MQIVTGYCHQHLRLNEGKPHAQTVHRKVVTRLLPIRYKRALGGDLPDANLRTFALSTREKYFRGGVVAEISDGVVVALEDAVPVENVGADRQTGMALDDSESVLAGVVPPHELVPFDPQLWFRMVHFGFIFRSQPYRFFIRFTLSFPGGLFLFKAEILIFAVLLLDLLELLLLEAAFSDVLDGQALEVGKEVFQL